MSHHRSSTSTVLPIRVENELLDRLDALLQLRGDITRTALAREVLRRGLAVVELDWRGRPAVKPTRLPEFARKVLAAAVHAPEEGRLDAGPAVEPRVFISAAWYAFQRAYPNAGLSLGSFKVWLVEANRQRLLSLVTDDLAAMHDAGIVTSSATEAGTSTFHLLCVPRRHEGSD